MPGFHRLGWSQFTLRSALAAMLVAALASAWLASYFRPPPAPAQAAAVQAGDSAFQRASFQRGRLAGAILTGDVATFQIAEFDAADLAGAKLTGEGAAFQAASFAGATLRRAQLAGRFSSFQQASFARADLTGARLTGDHTAFQGADFSQATLHGATFVSAGQALQGLILDDARFQGADLSKFDPAALAGCTFTDPPAYDGRTRFPQGFDPAKAGWRKSK